MNKFIVLLIIMAISGAAYSAYLLIPAKHYLEPTVVTKVIDGDTVVVEGGQRIRLLNIDTRERGENCYAEAKKRMEELVLLKNVMLERDKEDKDRYDRLLRYIYVGNMSVNIEMVREGLAIVYIYEPNVKYRSEFIAAEQEGKTAGGCVWVKKP